MPEQDRVDLFIDVDPGEVEAPASLPEGTYGQSGEVILEDMYAEKNRFENGPEVNILFQVLAEVPGYPPIRIWHREPWGPRTNSRAPTFWENLGVPKSAQQGKTVDAIFSEIGGPGTRIVITVGVGARSGRNYITHMQRLEPLA